MTFANERTFLAWVRTAMALIAGGVGLSAIQLQMPTRLQHSLSPLLVALGVGCASASWIRWALNERAMRLRQPLPGSPLNFALAAVLAGVAIALAVSVTIPL